MNRLNGLTPLPGLLYESGSDTVSAAGGDESAPDPAPLPGVYLVLFSFEEKSRADILEMENLVKIIRASLQGASITTQTVDAQAFIDIVGEMINHNPTPCTRKDVSWTRILI